MKIYGFETVDRKPALYHSGMNLLVLSDLHLGLEGGMTSKGSYVPEFQLDELLEDLHELEKRTDATRLLVNGDLKNEFKTSLYSEKEEIEEFIEEAEDLFEELILIEGNHDTFIESIIEEKGYELKKYFLEDKVLFTHGHISLEDLEVDEDFETVVIGHEHPALELKDDVGVKEKVDCFLYGRNDNGKALIVMPAFSTISNGSGVNNMPSSELLSPILREFIDKNSMKALAVSREAGLFDFPELSKIN
ncbi:MAG: metallophosphoesterase [Candidatus Nanohalobium sp.]